MSVESKQIALLICSVNRFDYLQRTLGFYSNCCFPGKIYIGIVNYSAMNLKKLENFSKKISETLNLVVVFLQTENVFLGLKKLLNECKEKYVVYAEDDHYLFFSAIMRCAQFLEVNKDYRTAHGHAITYTQKSIVEKPKHLKYYMMRNICDDNPKNRLINYYKKMFIPFFSLHRRMEFIEDLLPIDQYEDINFHELIINSLSIIRGKAKLLPILYMMRPHPRPKHYNIPACLDWIRSKEWQNAYHFYEVGLVQALGNNSTELVRNCFLMYMQRRVSGSLKGLNRIKSLVSKLQKGLLNITICSMINIWILFCTAIKKEKTIKSPLYYWFKSAYFFSDS